MKNRLHDKKAGIAILVALIVISLAEIIFRAAAMGLEAVLTTANLGEQIAVIVLAVTILILTAKGKDRACYICYGAWASYFILDELFELPGMVANFISNISDPAAMILRLLAMVCIVAIGVLLVEYMTDGTICNRAFNALCLITILLLVLDIFAGVGALFFAPSNGVEKELMTERLALAIFNNVYRLVMVFMFTFFAYDSAKAQLKKVNLSK